MRHILLAGAGAIALSACSALGTPHADVAASSNLPTEPVLGAWGVDLTAMDATADPGDDFNRYVNGAWIDTNEIPADRSRYGSFDALRENSDERVKAIIEDIAAGEHASGTEAQKIKDMFNNWMDAGAIEARGLAAVQDELDAIAAADSREALTRIINSPGVASNDIFGMFLNVDSKSPDRYSFYVGQAGLGLPDRDYYFNDADRFAAIRAAYVAHVAEMLTLAGVDGADAKADAIMAFETNLAESHWDRVKRRNRDLTYNKMTLAELETYAPGYDWSAAFDQSGAAKTDYLVVTTKDAMPKLAATWAETDLQTLKDYATFHTLSNNAQYLPAAFDEASFNFFGRTLNGQPEQRERWKRGVTLVNGYLGFAVGKEYVARHFPPEAKAEMERLVDNLRTALGMRIDELDWMGEDTKVQAHDKLAKFTPKVGYPDVWEDYSAMTIVEGDLMANVKAARVWNWEDSLSKVGGPVDETEWGMTPQTVNAYYSPTRNEIVFPAAILQAPFFDLVADPAVNYGGIGAVIGHEMGHGFDDQGAKSDGDGVLRDWWTADDKAAFEARTGRLAAQYDEFEPLPGHRVNGKLTLGENIGDNGGMAMAYEAYKLSLDGGEPPVLDGYTGDQRFFMAWAQVWRGKIRDEALINRLATDSHSPGDVRAQGPVRNMDAWYAAFDVTEDDALFIAPEDRVKIW